MKKMAHRSIAMAIVAKVSQGMFYNAVVMNV